MKILSFYDFIQPRTRGPSNRLAWPAISPHLQTNCSWERLQSSWQDRQLPDPHRGFLKPSKQSYWMLRSSFSSLSLPKWIQLTYGDFPAVSPVTEWCLKDPKDSWLNKVCKAALLKLRHEHQAQEEFSRLLAHLVSGMGILLGMLEHCQDSHPFISNKLLMCWIIHLKNFQKDIARLSTNNWSIWYK